MPPKVLRQNFYILLGMDTLDSLQQGGCWNCGKKIDLLDSFCRHCGKGQGSHIPWYYGHFGIIVLTLLAMGPFSLILVWKSPRLGTAARWAYSAAIMLFSWYAFKKLYDLWQTVSSVFSSSLQI